MARLGTLAQLVRSKDAGPLVLTFDTLLADPDMYRRVTATGLLGLHLSVRLYRVPTERVPFAAADAGLACKVTAPRPLPSGGPADMDVYVGQKSAPILEVEVPL